MTKARIAIQSKGRLFQASLLFLGAAGLAFEKNGRNYIMKCANAPLELLLVRDDDIPEYVAQGAADFGIVGENVLLEKQSPLPIIKKLGFGKCSLVLAVPANSSITRLEQ